MYIQIVIASIIIIILLNTDFEKIIIHARVAISRRVPVRIKIKYTLNQLYDRRTKIARDVKKLESSITIIEKHIAFSFSNISCRTDSCEKECDKIVACPRGYEYQSKRWKKLHDTRNLILQQIDSLLDIAEEIDKDIVKLVDYDLQCRMVKNLSVNHEYEILMAINQIYTSLKKLEEKSEKLLNTRSYLC